MSSANQTNAATLAPPAAGVKVRLYNPGFGDCLLLAFRADDGGARYLLIDCGVHHQYTDPQHRFDRRQRMEAVAADIASATGHRLHVVAATHEHTDHLTGFDYARRIFDDIEIDDLWLAWTEDPDDAVAKELKKGRRKAAAALTVAAARLQMHGEPLGTALQGVVDFEYTGKQSGPLDYLRRKSRKQLQRSEDYRRPGEVLTLPGVSGVKVYVLGPPRDKKEYIDIVENDSQLYPEFQALREVDDFVVAALMAEASGAPDEETRQLEQFCRPFDQSLMLSLEQMSGNPDLAGFFEFFQTHYGFGAGPDEGPEWRRIENDWLGSAEQLALKLNDRTNNTSLVLAIELTATQPRQVLLFAADAQAGNWLSWQELSWPPEAQGQDKLTVAELLRRTVFYKVGHHGSRNATLRQQGLELMTSPDLVAMIPVDEVWACGKNPPWQHPAKTLLQKLTDRTRGRIIRSDQIPRGDEPPQRPAAATQAEWDRFIQALEWDRTPDRLWVQFTVGD